MAAPRRNSHRDGRDEREYDSWRRDPAYHSRDRYSDYDDRHRPHSHSRSSNRDRSADMHHHGQARLPSSHRTSPARGAYYDYDRPGASNYNGGRRGSSQSSSSQRGFQHDAEHGGYHGFLDSQENFTDAHGSDRSQSYNAPSRSPSRPGSANGVLHRHAHNAHYDTALPGQETQFLLIRDLPASADEEALASGMKKLYKSENASEEAPPRPTIGTGLRSTGLKSTSIPRNLGAKKDSLKRVFLVREERGGLSCGYGFAEFHSKEDAKAAYEKSVHDKSFTVAAAQVKVFYAHLGVFVPAQAQRPDEYTHAAGSATAQRFEYRIPKLYAREHVVSETAPEDIKAAEVSQQSAQGAPEGTGSNGQGDIKSKKRKAEEGAGSKNKAPRMKLPAFDSWNKAQAELGSGTNGPAEKVEKERVADELVDFVAHKCYLCNRKFGGDDMLRKHVVQSNLHKTNLTKQEEMSAGWERLKKAKPSTTVPKPAEPEFRDRAEERRRQYGSSGPDGPSRKDGGRGKARSPSPAGQPSIGEKMMMKAGYTAGTGLGASGTGMTAPMETNMYRSGVGLGAEGGKMGEAQKVASQGYVESAQDSARDRFKALQGQGKP